MRPDTRKVFPGPSMWADRKGTRWEFRGCSTPGCTARAQYLIAESEHDHKANRYACPPCRETKYAHLAGWVIEDRE